MKPLTFGDERNLEQFHILKGFKAGRKDGVKDL